MKPNLFASWCAFTALTFSSALAADWPQWRGPNRDDHSPDTGIAKSWPEGGPKQLWVSKALGKGAVHFVDGMLVCLEENSGTVVLAEASTKEWKEHGRFKLAPQTTQRNPKGKVWTHPVVVNGKLYLRDQELLSCYDVAGK